VAHALRAPKLAHSRNSRLREPPPPFGAEESFQNSRHLTYSVSSRPTPTHKLVSFRLMEAGPGIYWKTYTLRDFYRF